MATKELTDAELLVLGLVAEMPRYGYELDQAIDQRGMREWTQIGFSSIYFVLGKLEKAGLVKAAKPPTSRSVGSGTKGKARKIYGITSSGRKALATRTESALCELRPVYSSILLGMVNWSVLGRDRALSSLKKRAAALEAEQARLAQIQFEQQPLPDFVEALFDYTTGQLAAESRWVAQTLEYMSNKPWLDEADTENERRS